MKSDMARLKKGIGSDSVQDFIDVDMQDDYYFHPQTNMLILKFFLAKL